ncbi:unnamed protein product [Knipowitschia caucasica]|uniref:Fibrinogen C-terminal domain-containing protein n=1 Tax=Knipowitschia caucasica TaxID=637954 RepID=A0AAV2L227_KNICA
MTAVGLALALLLTSSFSSSSSWAYPSGSRDRQISWDDVNIVAHGLLQLGQALKEHVDRSKTQVKALNLGLETVNQTLGRLQQDGERRNTEMGERVERLERLEQKVDEVVRQQAMESNSSDGTEAKSVQRMMAAQNRRIDSLMEKIQQQQDKLEKQSLHLQTLQSKLGQKRTKSFRRRHEVVLQKDQNMQKGFAKDCHQLYLQGQRTSGVYMVQPQHSLPFRVLCEMTPDGGWTVVQKRYDGSQSFDLSWNEYKKGFGAFTGEFWLGLEHMHALSSQGRHTLQMELSDWSGQSHVISSEFRLDGEEGQFSLHLSPQTGASVEGLFSVAAPGSSSGLPFSTADQDNDQSTDNCALKLSGGWWFSDCGDSNLNGEFPSSPRGARSMSWSPAGGWSALRSSVMRMGPVSQ